MTVKQDFNNGYAPVNGIKMYYEIHGEGNPLILIHGGGSNIQTTFGKVLPLLSEHHKVIAVELQAHGHTNDRDAPESFKSDASDIAALLSYLKIKKADFLGFSNGGQTCIQLSLDHPELINKMIIASAFYKRDGVVKGFFDGMAKATLQDMPSLFREAYLTITHDSAGLQNMFEKDKARMVEFKGWSDEQISSIKVPTLIMAGNKDVMTLEHALEMNHRIPNSELVILPGTHGYFLGEGMPANENSKIQAAAVAIIEEYLNEEIKP
ncbi:MAG: alpha/beta hydrolase [Bacteroidetes bacterium]|nr:alpha/beta hydrolase [Bacteroidota bacterium]